MTKVYALVTHNVFYQEIIEAYFSSMEKLNDYFKENYPTSAKSSFWAVEIEVDPSRVKP